MSEQQDGAAQERGKASGGRSGPRKRKPATDQAGAPAPPVPARGVSSFPIVGVGASAGGLEALTELLTCLPADTGMAFVLIQHLAPSHRTILPEILSRHTEMPVVLAENGLEVRPNSVYIIAPDADMTVFHGHLNLTERNLVGGMHLPVDHFLRSLAADRGTRAVGVILSGSGSDGALGLTAVKAEGGITFAQDPVTARYDGMPSAAIAARAADFVLAPEGIAAELARLGKDRYLRRSPSAAGVRGKVDADEHETDALTKIFVTLRGVFRVDFGNYRTSTIRRRIERRMVLLRMDSLDEYASYLRSHGDEVEELYHDVLIMVTEFFREPEVYQALLESALPGIIDAKRDDDPIRVWVPGCATGEEPYSLALCIVKALKEADRDLPVKIFGTDISERDIDRARSGLFGETKIQTVPDEFRHFFSATDGGYRISKTIRDLCIFARHDVTSDPPFSQIDLVSCRNLLIYLEPSAQERVLPIFHYALRPGGYLVLGSSESIGSSADLFSTLDKKLKIFVRREVGQRLPAHFAYPYSLAQELEMSRHEREHEQPKRAPHFDLQQAAADVLLADYTPPNVVIDERFEILRFHGDTDRYLKHARGRASLNLLDMAREGLASEIRRVVGEARRGGRAASGAPARVRVGGAVHDVALHAAPLTGLENARFYLVLFEPLPEVGPATEAAASGGVKAAEDSREIEHLRREIAASREYSQTLARDKEATLEELRAANEEIQSSNEELQSINEELETAKEELQSTNEELRTVNEELENRNLQLSRANDDLNNLLRAVSVPTIMIGRDLRIRRFTPGTERVMNLIATDIGRPITDIAPRLELDDLEDVLREVIDNAIVHDREIQDEHGRWHAMRVRPYQTEENRIEGAIITLVDIDDMRRALLRATEVGRYAEGVNAMMAKLRGGLRSGGERPAVLDPALKALGADAALVLRRVDGGWEVEHAQGLSQPAVGKIISDEELPQARMAEASAAPVSVRAAVHEVLRPAPEGLTIGAVVVVPLFESDRVTGVLAFTWSAAGSAPSEEQLDFAATAASIVSLVHNDDRPPDGEQA